MRITTTLALVLALAACPHPTPEPKPIPGPATCADACARAFELGCPWAQPTAEGRGCMEVCRVVTDEGGQVAFNLECRARASSCAAAERCEE